MGGQAIVRNGDFHFPFCSCVFVHKREAIEERCPRERKDESGFAFLKRIAESVVI
jgi:hypothetical protein